jgi:cytochrome c-type biogenesis protein CcmE
MSRKLLIGTVLVSAGVLAVVLSFDRREAMYSRSVSEFLAHPILDRPVRVHGELVRGSLVHRETPCEYRFRLAGFRGATLNDAGLSVRYPECIVPDNLRDEPGADVTVVVEGQQCASCHDFKASQIYTRVARKYEMKERIWTPEQSRAPHRSTAQ